MVKSSFSQEEHSTISGTSPEEVVNMLTGPALQNIRSTPFCLYLGPIVRKIKCNKIEKKDRQGWS